MRSGRYGSWCSESPLHLAVEISQVVVSVIEALRPEAQCNGCSVLHLASAGVEDLSSTYLLLRTEPQPGCEGRGVAEARNIWPNLHHDGMRGQGTDTRHVGKIDTRDAKQFFLKIEAGLVASALIDPLLGARWSFVRRVLGTRKLPHLLRKFQIHLGHQVLIEPICCQGLAKREQMLRTIVSFQRLRDGLA